MKNVFLLFAVIALALAGCRRPAAKVWACHRELHSAIAEANRIVVRDGGFNGPRPIDKQNVLFQVTDPKEIALVFERLEFQETQELGACPCVGYPGIDWYQGKTRLVVASVQHCRAIRWKDFPGDAALTEDSQAWLKQWLLGHGVKEAAMRLE